MEIVTQQQTEIIQIQLYPLVKTVPSLASILKIGVMMSALSYLLMYNLFFIKEPLLIISTSSLTWMIALVIWYHRFLFPVSNTTLILAHNSFYLLYKNQLKWSKKIASLHFKKQQLTNIKTAVLHIYEKEKLLYLDNERN